MGIRDKIHDAIVGKYGGGSTGYGFMNKNQAKLLEQFPEGRAVRKKPKKKKGLKRKMMKKY